MQIPPLLGFRVGVTAGRRADEQATFLRRRGAEITFGPTLASESHAGTPALLAATESVVAHPPDVLVLTTGVGMRAWFADADAAGLGDALREVLAGAEILARGPKAAGAVVAAGLDVAWRAPNERSRDLLEHLATRADLAGLRVVVQLHGHESPWLAEAVAGLGCDVVAVRPYRWCLPDDVAPALALVDAVCAGDVDAVTFTSAPAVDNLVTLARSAGLGDALVAALGSQVAAVCVGPVSAEACTDHGIPAVEPARPRMEGMVQALCEHLSGRRRTLRLAGTDVLVSSWVVLVGGEPVTLSRRERLLLAALCERPGALLSKTALLERAWPGEDADGHAVEMAVARLRRRLGPAGPGVETVVRRGYRLAVA